MSSNDSDDDDLDWEEFQELSEEQIEAMFGRAMKEYSDTLDRMTPKQLYEHRRRRRLDLCLKQRKLIREFGMDFFVTHLKSTQRSFVAQRIEYRTGVRVGHA